MGSFSWLAAASGFAASYFNSKFIEERKARIERVNEQLREFVGPLLATVATSHSAWAAMVAQTGMAPRAFAAAVAADPAGQEAAAYRAWMTSVLQPLNEKAARLVFERIDLLDDIAAVPELMQLVAHTCTTRVVLQRWGEGDLSARSRVSYPDGLLQWSQREFLRAKRHQASLLGTGGKAGGDAVKKAVVGGGGEGGSGGAGGPGGSGGGGLGGGGSGSDADAPLAVPTHPRQLVRSRL